jgi:hypothetical protein
MLIEVYCTASKTDYNTDRSRKRICLNCSMHSTGRQEECESSVSKVPTSQPHENGRLQGWVPQTDMPSTFVLHSSHVRIE